MAGRHNFFWQTKTLSAIEKSLKVLRASILFDAVWYKEAHEDLRRTSVDPIWHYLEHGAREGRHPHPLFDSDWYISHNPDAQVVGVNPLLHYLTSGASRGRNPHPLFDINWYLEQLPTSKQLKTDALSHYLKAGWRHGLSPHPLFDPKWYGACAVNDVAMSPLLHYVQMRSARQRSPHPMFDPAWYMEQYHEAVAAGEPPLIDYLRRGWRKGRRPNKLFDPVKYARTHLAAQNTSEEPLTHFVRINAKNVSPSTVISIADDCVEAFGDIIEANDTSSSDLVPSHRGSVIGFTSVHEWRKAIKQSGLFDAEWYLTKNKDIALAKLDPLDHFIRHGSAEQRSPGPAFNAAWYVEEYPEVALSGLEPLAHYLKIGRAKGFEPIGTIYQRWIKRFDTVAAADRAMIEGDIAANVLPALQLIVLVDKESEDFLVRMIDAISAQIFHDWHALVIISRGCSESIFHKAMSITQTSPQFHVIMQNDVAEDTLKPADGRHVVIAAGSILLCEHALYMFARAAVQKDNFALIYADEDILDKLGNRDMPVFKPKYSPALAEQTNYFGRCLFIRSTDWVRLDMVQAIKEESFAIDRFVFSFLDKPNEKRTSRKAIGHIPAILFHDLSASHATITRPIDLTEVDAHLPSFSIIIPTRDHVDLLRPCIESIEQCTDYPRAKIEIIIVDNGSVYDATLSFFATLASEGRARILQDAGGFNFSRLNNVAAAEATHDILLFVNNDTVLDDALWLRRIAHFVTQEDVAAVGGKLLYPDRTIQHGGVVLGIQGVAGHDQVGLQEHDDSARLDVTREMSAVTGACLAMRREVFNELGGFDTVAAIAFNDTLLCLAALKAGYRNIFIKEPLLIHHESKSRGYDDKPERVAAFRREAAYARRRHNDLFRDDPYYSPNLCLQAINELAFPPRCSKPWRVVRRDPARLRILFLSSTHEMGHGVPVVMNLQASHLARAGHDIFVGGPKGQREMAYEGCRRIYLSGAAEAAAFAVEQGMDCVIVETPPFFSIARWLGEWPRTLFLDHGEPPPEFFPDAAARRTIAAEKRMCLTMASKVFAISAAVRNEGYEVRAQIIPNANSHLLLWEDSLRKRRDEVRRKHGWENKIVVLNVCRLHTAERHYKGVDKYAELLQEFQFARPTLAAQTVFVLCGKATPGDVEEMQKVGFEIFENVTDKELGEFYLAADVYANFSRWEGYNLGIGQALAVGLPVIASDITAHRAFPIYTSNDILNIIEKFAEIVEEIRDSEFSMARAPIVTDWKGSLVQLEHEIVDLCRPSEASSEANFARA